MSKAKQWFLKGALRPIKGASEAMALVAFNYNHNLTLIPLGYFEDLSPLGGGGGGCFGPLSDLGN